MDILIPLLLTLVGVFAGIVSGMFGVGGGLVVVPSLILATGLGFTDAVAASLLFMIFTTPFGIHRYWKAGNVDFRTGAVLAAAGLGGVLLGTWVQTVVAERALMLAFVVLLVASSQNLAYGRLPTKHNKSLLLVLGVGLFAGLVAKLFGIGGGIVVVPSLVFTGVPIHLAIGTSLVTVFTNGLVSTLINLLHPGTWAYWSIPLVIGGLGGIQLGSRQALKTHGAHLKRWFALFMVLVAVELARRAL